LQRIQKMNYTKVYRQVYEVLSKTGLEHEKIHNASLRITNALSEIYIYTNKQFPEALDPILQIAENFCSQVKVGGYDLDDKGLPSGYGISASGLKNKE